MLGFISARKACWVAPPASSAVREYNDEIGEVAEQWVEQHRVSVGVDRARESRSAAMHDHRQLVLLGPGIGGVQHPVAGLEAAVHRVDLEGDRAECRLPGELAGGRIVKVRVEVGDRVKPRRVLLDQGEHVLDRLDAGHLRAVLGKQQYVVDALASEMLVKLGRQRRTIISK